MRRGAARLSVVAVVHPRERETLIIKLKGIEIYYELPHALELFRGGRADQDEALQVSGPGDPLPDWLLEDWPAPEMKARIEDLRRASV